MEYIQSTRESKATIGTRVPRSKQIEHTHSLYRLLRTTKLPVSRLQVVIAAAVKKQASTEQQHLNQTLQQGGDTVALYCYTARRDAGRLNAGQRRFFCRFVRGGVKIFFEKVDVTVVGCRSTLYATTNVIQVKIWMGEHLCFQLGFRNIKISTVSISFIGNAINGNAHNLRRKIQQSLQNTYRNMYVTKN